MCAAIPIGSIGPRLREALEHLPKGEALDVLGDDGEPMAVLIPLQARAGKPLSASEWDARWRAMAKRIGKAWESDKSAVETLAGMRR